jgi:hypothetical protein
MKANYLIVMLSTCRSIGRALLWLFLLSAIPAYGQAPAVLFTDVKSGAVTGGPGDVGVPISIFGRGFGAVRGASRVTIGGVEVASYMIWGHTINSEVQQE